MAISKNLSKVTSYEIYLIICILLSATFLVLSSNLRLDFLNNPDLYPTVESVFTLSLVSMLLGLFSLIMYNVLGDPVDIDNVPSPKRTFISLIILTFVWCFNYYITHIGIHRIGIFSAVSTTKLAIVLGKMAGLFAVILAIIENSIFAVVLPILLLRVLFKIKDPSKAPVLYIFIVSALSGMLATLWHIAWQGPLKLLTTFTCFTSWAFVTLYTKNPIFADAMHAIGNGFGILYIIIHPEVLYY